MDTDWQLQEIHRQGSRQGRLIFRPTWLTPELADNFLWKHSKSFTLISATFLPLSVECKRLGIDPDDVDYHECPSTFNPERSPVHIWPVASLSSKTMDEALPKVVSAVNTIMAIPQHQNQRGLIHTVSYKLSKAIIEGVSTVNRRRLVTHDSINRQDVINQYIDSYDKSHPDGKVLISPSAERGIDLRYGLCLGEGTLVRTRKGYVPIEKLKVGDYVWTHKRRFRKITATSKRLYEGVRHVQGDEDIRFVFRGD